MKIAVNTRHVTSRGIDGIGRFTYETFKIITQNHPEIEFLYLFDRNFSSQFITNSNIRPVVVYPPTLNPTLVKIWYNYSLPFVFRKHKPDLFVSTDGLLCLRSSTKQLGVIHDLNFEYYHDSSNNYNRFFLDYYPKSAAAACRIATVSEYSKMDIVNRYKIDESKIDVVHNGVSSVYRPVSDEIKMSVKKELTNGCDYFVFVGSMYERKNILRLLQAYEKFKAETGSPFKLVLAGRKRYALNEMENFYTSMHYKDDVIFTGRLTDERMNQVLGSAIALTYVSLFEGFGIPLLEAFACDVPIITSNVTSMPEVAGNAACFVDPLNVDEIVQAMQTIATRSDFREELIKNGRLQRQKYSWNKSAKLLWGSIEKCL